MGYEDERARRHMELAEARAMLRCSHGRLAPRQGRLRALRAGQSFEYLTH